MATRKPSSGSKPSTPVSGIEPMAGYLLVEPQQQEKTTASGIVLPDTHEGEKPQQGRVVAVGESMLHESGQLQSAPVSVNATVIYKKWGGNEYKPAGSSKEYMFIKFDDILAEIK